jgi:putative membrane protein
LRFVVAARHRLTQCRLHRRLSRSPAAPSDIGPEAQQVVIRAALQDSRLGCDEARQLGYASPMKILVRWLLLAAALLLVAQVYPGVVVTSFTSALIAAFVLGLFNTLLRPILVLLTLPVTVLTLGLFLFVINALMFFFAASVLKGFSVTGFGAALIGSVLYSLCGLVIDAAMERIFSKG